ncbi:hypothetical protein CDAR_509451 [Caerostris darwini]|uniref:Uncharacterized protein n=1 Tax=Caerostris darwini TaxID=1538125 RepID=A0AAV4R4P0_9ARAC|nr:hypothetical protein CDAR_509451 [Caerostris darwini]
MDGLKLPMEKKIHHCSSFPLLGKKGKEDDNEVEKEEEDRMVEVGGGFVFRKRVRYEGVSHNRATVAFASLELVQKFRVAISSRKAAAICFSFVLETFAME